MDTNDGNDSVCQSQTCDESLLPPAPERPLDSDCCGNGCVPCVFDIYEDEVAVWKSECDRLRGQQRKGSEERIEHQNQEILPLQLEQYNLYPIESICKETEDVVRVRFTLSKNKKLGLSIGQHVIIRCIQSDGSMVTRQYTPISPLDAAGHFEFIIKIYDEGSMSKIVKKWKVGDEIYIRGPLGTFAYHRNKFQHILMLCAGTGVAPMCQVIGSVLADDRDDTVIRLVYGCRSYKQLIATAELEEWKRFWNFSAVFVLSQEPVPPPQRYKYGEEILSGHINRHIIEQELSQRCISDTLVLVCGTRNFEKDMLTILRELNVQSDNIHKF